MWNPCYQVYLLADTAEEESLCVYFSFLIWSVTGRSLGQFTQCRHLVLFCGPRWPCWRVMLPLHPLHPSGQGRHTLLHKKHYHRSQVRRSRSQIFCILFFPSLFVNVMSRNDYSLIILRQSLPTNRLHLPCSPRHLHHAEDPHTCVHAKSRMLSPFRSNLELSSALSLLECSSKFIFARGKDIFLQC